MENNLTSSSSKKVSASFKPYPCLEGNVFASVIINAFSFTFLAFNICLVVAVYGK